MRTFVQFRLLGVVLLLAGIAAAWEFSHPDSETSSGNRKYPYVMRELYPQSARILYTEAVSLVIDGNLSAARKKFEAALATGDKTIEDLLYYYAVTLVRMNADPQEIDEAVANWRFNFPFSSRTDPRAALERESDPAAGDPADGAGDGNVPEEHGAGR